MVIVAALASALAYAVAMVLQQRSARRTDPACSLRPSLIVRLLGQPVWLLGIVCNVVAFGLRALALRQGSLVLVQPLLLTGLFFALVLETWLGDRKLTGRDLAASAALVAGLSVFALAAAPDPGTTEATNGTWLAIAALAVPLVGGAVAVASRLSGDRRASGLALGGGLLLAVVAALTKQATAEFAADGLGVIGSWTPYALLGAIGLSVLVTQSAFQAGALRASLPVLSVVEPLASIGIGAWAFHETTATSAVALVAQSAGLGVLLAGAVALSRAEPETRSVSIPGATAGDPTLPAGAAGRVTSTSGEVPAAVATTSGVASASGGGAGGSAAGVSSVGAIAVGRDVTEHAGTLVLAVSAMGWVVVLAQILRHRIYVSHDTVINYAHVWYASDRLWQGDGLPTRMPALGHGEAFTFPYGFLPWTSAALLRPLLGDWTVTLLLVVATVGVIMATFWAFPELRRGWWAAAVLVEPALVSSPLIGQIPFMCGTSLLLVAIGAWRRDRRTLATIAVGLAQATHPAIVLPLAAAIVVGRLPWEPRRRTLLGCYAISLLFAIPALWVTLNAPVMEESSLGIKLWGFIATIAPRSLMVLVPIALVFLHEHWRYEWRGPAIIGGLALANVLMWAPLGMPWAWQALFRQPDTRMVAFTESEEFVPDATYRVLRVADGKIGMYQLLRGGGRLDSEFFPESIHRRSWAAPGEYVQFLASRQVDFVMVWDGYTQRFRTNEEALLDQLLAAGCTDGAAVERVVDTADYDLYAVSRCGGTSEVRTFKGDPALHHL